MKRVLIALGVALAFVYNLYAQDFCGTPAITNIENVKKLSSPQKRSANTTYTLRIYFHVIRSSSGTGGVSTSNVESAYGRLNSDFNSHGIYFFWDGNIDYIDNNSYYNNVPNTYIFNVNNHINGIDIYLFPAYPNYPYSFAGKANGVGMNSEYLVVGNINGTPICTTSTISHEMGHVLNLWHTHHGTYNEGGNDNPCPELVNGSNSSTCGDYVEDTPADPNIGGMVNGNCVYIGTGTDANNQAYDPDVDLIMSYAPKSCRTRFSTKQGERMRDAIENLPYLMHTQYHMISGPSLIYCSSSGTYSINDLPSVYTVNWSVNNNSFIVTPYSNHCLVTYNGTEQGTQLTANIYYNSNLIKQFSKSISGGIPLITGELRITGGDGSHLHWTSNIGGNTVDIEEVCNIPLNYSQFEGDLYRLSPITFEPEATPIRHWNSFGVHEVVDYLTPGWYLLMVRGINNCGVSADLGAEIECVDTDMLRANGNGTELALMYNRLGQVLTVSVNHADHSTTNNAYTIQLWNETNMVRELRLMDSTVQIPMAGLKNGLYTIRYVNNDEVIAKKFMK